MFNALVVDLFFIDLQFTTELLLTLFQRTPQTPQMWKIHTPQL